MSMFIEIYEVIPKEELSQYIEKYKKGALVLQEWKLESKTVHKIANELDLRFKLNGDPYYRMVPIRCGSYRQGWFMKKGWYRHNMTEAWFTDLNKFTKYCLKYMRLKDPDIASVYHETVENFKNDPSKEKIIMIAW